MLQEHSRDPVPLFLPRTKYEWAERVIVRPPVSDPSDGASFPPLDPLALSSGTLESVDPKDMHELLQSVFQECTSGSTAEQEVSERAGCRPNDSMESNDSIAELLPPMNIDEENASVVGEHQRIYLLGLVFYEIFSGGERPLEARRNLVEPSTVRVDFEKRLVVSNDISDESNEKTAYTQ